MRIKIRANKSYAYLSVPENLCVMSETRGGKNFGYYFSFGYRCLSFSSYDSVQKIPYLFYLESDVVKLLEDMLSSSSNLYDVDEAIDRLGLTLVNGIDPIDDRD